LSVKPRDEFSTEGPARHEHTNDPVPRHGICISGSWRGDKGAVSTKKREDAALCVETAQWSAHG